jgi:hypothetical protein
MRGSDNVVRGSERYHALACVLLPLASILRICIRTLKTAVVREGVIYNLLNMSGFSFL